MNFQFRPAIRQDTKPLIALYGPSGCGKTMSALLLARGMVGPNGKIAMIDTEAGRGSLYADVIPGGYDVLQLGGPFSAERYIEAIETAEKSGADCLVIDSASHEWEGIGGVLSQAEAIADNTGKSGLHCWAKPKGNHQKFVLKLLGSSLPVILCIRAKYKSRQVKQNGKTVIVKDDFPSPIQAEDFIFEMTAHAEIRQDHTINLTKCNHPELRGCFPDGNSITVESGEAIAEWAGGSGSGLDTVALLTAARKAASEGKEQLQAHWKALDQPERAVVHAIMDELKRVALEAGADDDPFNEFSEATTSGEEPESPTPESGDEQDVDPAGSTENAEDGPPASEQEPSSCPPSDGGSAPAEDASELPLEDSSPDTTENPETTAQDMETKQAVEKKPSANYSSAEEMILVIGTCQTPIAVENSIARMALDDLFPPDKAEVLAAAEKRKAELAK